MWFTRRVLGHGKRMLIVAGLLVGGFVALVAWDSGTHDAGQAAQSDAPAIRRAVMVDPNFARLAVLQRHPRHTDDSTARQREQRREFFEHKLDAAMR
jgi:hypothetical protein